MNDKKISKFLSLVLRHRPKVIGLQLDDQGWAEVPDLLEKMKIKGINLDLTALIQLVDTNDKQRFKLSKNFKKIRANQGHSLPIDLAIKSKEPPSVLFHGTATRFLTSIKENGLLKMNRQHVHLSTDHLTAKKVGERHGKPLILTIDTKRMFQNGKAFYLSENGVWLTDSVPFQYIKF